MKYLIKKLIEALMQPCKEASPIEGFRPRIGFIPRSSPSFQN